MTAIEFHQFIKGLRLAARIAALVWLIASGEAYTKWLTCATYTGGHQLVLQLYVSFASYA